MTLEPSHDNSSTPSHTENAFIAQIPRCQALKITTVYITEVIQGAAVAQWKAQQPFNTHLRALKTAADLMPMSTTLTILDS